MKTIFLRKSCLLAFTIVLLTFLSCKSRNRKQNNSASLRIASAPDTTAYMNSLPADRRAAAEQLLKATALVQISRKDSSGVYNFCSGTIVSKFHVVLATHCFATPDKTRMEDPSTLTIKVTIGRYSYPASVLFMVPGYKPGTISNQPDVTVLAVEGGYDLTYPGGIVPIAIASDKLRIIFPSKTEPDAPSKLEKGWVAGYGSTKWEKNVGGEILRIKPIEFADDNVDNLKEYLIVMSPEGANAAESKSELNRVAGTTCHGDSGGPSVVVRNGVPILIGVTSHGHDCERAIGYNATDVRKIPDLKTKLEQWAQFTDGTPKSGSVQANVQPVPSTPQPLPQRQVNPKPQSIPNRQVCSFRATTHNDAQAIQQCKEGLANSWPGREWAGIRYKVQMVQGVRCEYQCLMYGVGDPNDNDICLR